MLKFIEICLAFVGFVTVVAICGLWFAAWLNEQIDPSEPPTDPYDEGVAAAGRISQMAWEVEQALYHTGRSAGREGS